MLRKKIIALAVGFLSLTMCVGQEKISKVIIYPSSLEQRQQLIGLLEIDHFIESGGGIVSEISERDVTQLRLSGVKHQVLVDDVVKSLKEENSRFFAARKKGIDLSKSRVALEHAGSTVSDIIKTPSDFEVKNTFGGYYSFAEMETAMNVLVSKYSSIAQKTSIGKTAEGRDIWVIKISDNVAQDETNEPEVLYLGLQHAREAITGSSMIFFMQYLCENYNNVNDQRIRNLVDNREFFIIPCFNPDGWEHNRSSMGGNAGGDWRKNRSKLDSTVTITQINDKGNKSYDTVVNYTAIGVDLNRNWGVDWGNCSAPILGTASSCGSSTKTADTYYGPSAFSELETQAVRDFVKKHHIVAGFDQHAFGPYYSLPYGRKSLGHTMSQKGTDFFTAVPALMGTYNGMRAADSYDALKYEVAGGFKDWMLIGDLGSSIGTGRKDTVWAMTGEGAAGGGRPEFGQMANFWAPASQIESLSKGMCYQNLQLAYAAGTYVDIQDENDIAMTSLSGNLKFRIKRLGLGNDEVTISITPLDNVKTVGAPVIVKGMAYYEDVTGNISYQLAPTLTNGQKVRFAWNVTTAGYSYSDTVVKLYNPTQVFFDDMEGAFSTNWTATSDVADNWNYTTLAAKGGSKSLTESPAGSYTAGTTRRVTNKMQFDLSDATAAYLTFWTKHRIENFCDKLQVQVSTDGTTWIALPGRTTIQEPGTLDGSRLDGKPSLTGIRDYWTQEVFDLSAYKSSSVRFRFEFISNNVTSTFAFDEDEGVYIDNLKIVKSTAVLTPLPVTFMQFNGKLLQDNTVQLWWEAQTDEGHQYFEVERSNDGNAFTSLGRSNPLPPYQFNDLSPKVGNNFYRIKQVDKDGKVTYSKTINIILKPAIEAVFYPNPANNVLNIRLKAEGAERVTVKITDLQGRVMYKLNTSTHLNNDLKVDIRNWEPQFYIVTLYNSNNEVIATQKIVKY